MTVRQGDRGLGAGIERQARAGVLRRLTEQREVLVGEVAERRGLVEHGLRVGRRREAPDRSRRPRYAIEAALAIEGLPAAVRPLAQAVVLLIGLR
ncbi:hypothetical protein [Actinomadura rayongensis]|uniref:Uncharacterized protein n=1 Tax=Actinomadura rayongensis TaxID=1429076 RepID=A0A6I4WDH5_9ACTN|nr:hypothetical protein [Actinomadura rayongensis]MXQ65054.1 hypothetical protein [Actinomadura rayongensis]